MKFLISSDYKTFPINLHLLHIVEVCPKHFIFIGKNHFFTDERFEICNKESAQKEHRKGHTKSYFIFKLKVQHKKFKMSVVY